MTTERILEQVKRNPHTLIYFGNNIAQFREVAEAIYPECADRLVGQIDEREDMDELELAFRTSFGKFDGWNFADSLSFYNIRLDRGICNVRFGTLIDASKRTVKVV